MGELNIILDMAKKSQKRKKSWKKMLRDLFALKKKEKKKKKTAKELKMEAGEGSLFRAGGGGV